MYYIGSLLVIEQIIIVSNNYSKKVVYLEIFGIKK